MVRRRPFNLVLLDEQMPGKHGLDALRELREADPNLAIVMVTKSEEDSTMTEAIGAALEGYLVKPVTPRQVYAAITRLLDGDRLRQQVVARRFVERFRDLQTEPLRGLGWREWIDRFSEVTQWDLDLVAANETGLHESLQGLYPDLRREFAAFMKESYPTWLKDLE